MNNDLAIQFGRTLRKLRLARALSQQDLAFATNLDRTYISLLERGRRQPSLTTIFDLAKALGLKPEKLVAAIR